VTDAVLALVAVAHAVVSVVLARRLTRTEQAPAETQVTVLVGNFARCPANDQLRKAA
jgi:hypothetical protein